MSKPTVTRMKEPLPDTKDVGDALLRLCLRLYRLEIQALETVVPRLSLRQFRILDRVDREFTTITQLAALARRQLPTISKSVDSLVRQGLIERRASSTDRRAASLMLTPAGRKVLAEARYSLDELAAWVGQTLDLDLKSQRAIEALDALYYAAEERLRA